MRDVAEAQAWTDPRMKDESSHRQGLALVGLRGTGKSTVGPDSGRSTGPPVRGCRCRIGSRLPADRFRRSSPSRASPPSATGKNGCSRELTARPGTDPGDRRRRGPPGGEPETTARVFGFVVWLTADPAVLADRLLADPERAGQPPRADAGRHARGDRRRPGSPDPSVSRGRRRRRRDRRPDDPDEVADAILDDWHDRGEQSS